MIHIAGRLIKTDELLAIFIYGGCVPNGSPAFFNAKNERETENMINNEIITTKGMESVYKYMMGGVVHKYFPECYCFEESEMNEILKVALATLQCQKVIEDIKARAANQDLSSFVESEVK